MTVAEGEMARTVHIGDLQIGFDDGYAAGFRAGVERAAKECRDSFAEAPADIARDILALLDEPQEPK
jgi:hypothetical protein